MKIELQEITIRQIVQGYVDSAEEGVVGCDGKLNIRPKYQREFVYDNKKRVAVIQTILKGFPLNVMYWVKNSENSFEVMDGQQRTLSFCQYVNGDFSISIDGMDMSFANLTKSEQNKILDYKLMVYICEGNDQEILDWFKIINIAGEPLTVQEIRNATYQGEWVTDAKRYFSKSNCVAYGLAGKYMSGTPIRQDYLERVIGWIAQREGITIDQYMSKHQHDSHATDLWLYFQSVIGWVQVMFPVYRKEMKGLDWGYLFNTYGQNKYNPSQLENNVKELMLDDEVQNKKGIYEYLLGRDPKHLNLRAFSEKQKRQVYEKQNGICPHCVKENLPKTHHEYEEMEGDHITPWHEGGQTTMDNCQMLCKYHNRRKSGK